MSEFQLGYVPPMLPDETVYSTLAAACRLAPNTDLTTCLLGSARTAARVDWPVGLRAIARAMPSNLEVSGELLFRYHTFAPAHLAFMSETRREALLKSMYDVRAGEPARISGASTSSVKAPGRVRICPECWMRDLQQYRRAYIHRVHQFAGVVVCPEHDGSILQDTEIVRSGIYTRKAYFDVNRARIFGPAAALDSQRELSVAAAIAKTFPRLLDNDTHKGPEHIRLTLRGEIRARGYVFPGEKLDLHAFQGDFSGWFTPGISDAVGVRRPTDHSNASWIYRCLTRRTDAVHPLIPILLSLFLGVDVVELIRRELPTPVRPEARPSRPPGVSKTYARFEANRNMLKRLWHCHDLSLADLARRFNVNGLTVRRWAVALRLPFPRPGPKVIYAPVERSHRPDIRQQIRATRVVWVRLLKRGMKGPSRNPKCRKLYWWLARYDRPWLQRHMPRVHSAIEINWADRDRSLASMVESAAEAILNRIPPVRASKTRLAHQLGRAPWLLSKTPHFPKTSAKLRQFTESRSAFAERCSAAKLVIVQ